MLAMPAEPKRCLRREWKRNKPHLPKSTSLPSMQLIPWDRPLFTCQRCGFINTLIPLCLWCCWTSDDAHRQFNTSLPRPRRITAPPRVFWHVNITTEYRHQSRSSDTSVAQENNRACTQLVQQHLKPQLSLITVSQDAVPVINAGPMSSNGRRLASNAPGKECINSLGVHVPSTPSCGLEQGAARREDGDADTQCSRVVVPEGGNRVATETLSSSSQRSAKSLLTRQEGDGTSKYRASPKRLRRPIPIKFLDNSELRQPLSAATPAAPSSSVDRSISSTMNTMKSLSTKASRSFSTTHLILDFTGSNSLSFREHEQKKAGDLASSPPGSPTSMKTASQHEHEHEQRRTLRRKKHLSIFRTSAPAPSVVEPISIALTMHRPQSVQSDSKASHLPSSYAPLSYPIPESITSNVDSRPQSPGDSPTFRLGSPSRPYYTAIRKSRPISFSASPSRPMSYSSPTPARPTSALLSSASPPSSPFRSAFAPVSPSSAFKSPSLEADEADPTRYSSSSAPPSAFSYPRRSFGFASTSSSTGRGTGFSVSGETELRMALASAGGLEEGGYRFKEMQRDAGVKGRVKKLRRGLKELLAARKT